jgi:hypothetical protein
LAGFAGIAAAGKSIEMLLTAGFEELKPVTSGNTKAVLVHTSDFDPANAGGVIGSPALSIFL